MRLAAPLLFILSVSADIWLHVDVQNVEKKACPIDETSWGTETSGCAAMTYMSLDERILPHHERRSSSFEYVNGASRPTVTHWTRGKLSDWMVSIQFISVDPVYGLARTCDRSGYVRVFQNVSSDVDEPNYVERSLTIQGQCFVATVRVQASHEVCPWCIDESKKTTTTTTTELSTTNAPSSFFSLEMSNGSLIIIMIILTFLSFVALSATSVLLVFYVIDRKKPEIFEMPPPQANSTVIARNETNPFTTRSSERWGEYGCDTWSSFQPLDIENAYMSAKETRVYRVAHVEEEDSSDSGNGTF